MDATLQIILQCGALGILGYIVVWVTKVGGPGLFNASERIGKSIDANSTKMDSNTTKLADMERALRSLETQIKK